ncbi:MAG: hypothetical protein KL863_23750 [Rhizobium sp.]|nr:hypothetical protein [Rhizobium sp.]
MSIEWFTLISTAHRQGQRRDPLEDPLEGPDWQGLGWAAQAFAALLGRGAVSAMPQKYRKPVLGKSGPVVEERVCV